MIKSKKALVCGAGGFIGTHLVKKLKDEGYWVRGVDLKLPEFSKSLADDFQIRDLREFGDCATSLTLKESHEAGFDEVYQLAADMGGLGFIHSAPCEILHNNSLINIHMIDAAIREFKIPRYFFSSSVCIYRDMKHGEPELDEAGAYPAMPDNEYGWEKLFSERMAMAYGRKYGTTVRIARFQNCYGPEGAWIGGKEKAPAAICRKIASLDGNEGNIDIWGKGDAVRSYTFIDDMTDGIFRLMHSNLEDGVNIGCPQYVSVLDLVNTVARVAGKHVNVIQTPGPVGVESRNFSNARIYSTGWKSNYPLEEGIKRTYPWIKQQVEIAKKAEIPM